MSDTPKLAKAKTELKKQLLFSSASTMLQDATAAIMRAHGFCHEGFIHQPTAPISSIYCSERADEWLAVAEEALSSARAVLDKYRELEVAA